MDATSTSLKTIAQGVINAPFAKRHIQCAPVYVRYLRGRDRFAIHLDDSRVALIKLALDPEEFFAEALRNAVLRRLAIRDATGPERPKALEYLRKRLLTLKYSLAHESLREARISLWSSPLIYIAL